MYYKHICVYICTINIKCTVYVICFLPTEGTIILELKGTPTIKSEIYTDEQIKNELSLEE